jgi:hypothetical protein
MSAVGQSGTGHLRVIAQLPYRCDGEDVYAVTVRLSCPAPATPDAVAGILRLLHTVSDPTDGLEHAYAQPSGLGADLVLFLVADDLVAAERAAARLVARAQDAGLTDCAALTCEAELVVPFAEAALHPDQPH